MRHTAYFHNSSDVSGDVLSFVLSSSSFTQLADVKRVNRLRSGLEAVDIMAPSSDTLRELLLQTVSIHVYLRCDEVGDDLLFTFSLLISFDCKLDKNTRIPW